MSVAYAHTLGDALAQPLPHGLELLLAWTVDPTFLVPLAVAILYFRGLRAIRREGRGGFARWRPVLLLLGVVLAGVALLSPVDLLADYSFTWHMIQHMLIAQVSVPLILLAAPFLPVIRGLPERFRRVAFIPFARHPEVQRFFRAFTSPIMAFVCYVVALWAWHLPGLYDAALENDFVHYFEHFCFVVTSVQMHWHVVNPYPFRSRMHYLVRAAFLFVITVQNSALGALITFSDDVLYAYARLESFWGLSMMDDQLMGGLLMWVGGGMMHLFVIMAVLIVYAGEEERKEPHHPDFAPPGKSLRTA